MSSNKDFSQYVDNDSFYTNFGCKIIAILESCDLTKQELFTYSKTDKRYLLILTNAKLVRSLEKNLSCVLYLINYL